MYSFFLIAGEYNSVNVRNIQNMQWTPLIVALWQVKNEFGKSEEYVQTFSIIMKTVH